MYAYAVVVAAFLFSLHIPMHYYLGAYTIAPAQWPPPLLLCVCMLLLSFVVHSPWQCWPNAGVHTISIEQKIHKSTMYLVSHTTPSIRVWIMHRILCMLHVETVCIRTQTIAFIIQQ